MVEPAFVEPFHEHHVNAVDLLHLGYAKMEVLVKCAHVPFHLLHRQPHLADAMQKAIKFHTQLVHSGIDGVYQILRGWLCPATATDCGQGTPCNSSYTPQNKVAGYGSIMLSMGAADLKAPPTCCTFKSGELIDVLSMSFKLWVNCPASPADQISARPVEAKQKGSNTSCHITINKNSTTPLRVAARLNLRQIHLE
eukprot:CAMPEP_0117501088 /NCGR_PEP_ID=MMETSP0784-20121206/23115_1 /TAXON_ID=39447 /ORGANISM="" /LENGTH=195 /DNA_ID=CAMNT_0005296325 /DNA_START=1426 /DNA_END=2014 /DNA_ORIENTATION=+